MVSAANTGGSIGISLANNVLAHRAQFHQSRLVELVDTSTVQFQAALKQATDYFVAQGSSLAQAQQKARRLRKVLVGLRRDQWGPPCRRSRAVGNAGSDTLCA
jgi:hypothetical protein